MTQLFFRKLALAVVFAAGVLSIMATSPPPPPYHFRKVEIEPVYRCPGSDVAVRWTLSQPAPVTVAVGDIELVTTIDGRTVLPAEMLEHNAPVATLTLRLEAEDAEEPSNYEIMTLGSGRTIEKLAFHAGGNEFRMDDSDLWDKRARVLGIKIEQVRNLECAGGAVSPPAWEVSPPFGPSFVVGAENGYSAVLDSPPAPGGDWRFRPKGGECRLPSSGLEPYLSMRLTAVCIAAGDS